MATEQQIKDKIAELEAALAAEKAKLDQIYAEESKRITQNHYEDCYCNFCRVRIHYNTPEECDCRSCRERVMLAYREKAHAEGLPFIKSDPAEEVKPHKDLNCPYWKEGGCTKCFEWM